MLEILISFFEFLSLLLDNFIKEGEDRMTTKSLIGLSLSFCIKQICEGIIPENQVIKIITGTCCRSKTDWKKLIASYKRNYWSKFPNKAEEVLMRFRKDGRIEQPRFVNKKHYPMIPSFENSAYWVSDESEILWSDSVQKVQSFRDKFNEIVEIERLKGGVMLKIFQKNGICTLIPLCLYKIQYTYSGRIKGCWINNPSDKTGYVDINTMDISKLEAGSIDGVA